MILGMTPFTFVHVVLSLIGIASGFVVVFGLLRSQHRGAWTAIFLASTVATSLTGFALPFDRFSQSHWFGVMSLAALAAAISALYFFRLAGAWRRIYAIGVVIALYLNAAVLLAQAFRKIPALHALAPTESEPAFAIAQGLLLVAFVVIGIATARALRGGPPLTA